MNDTRFERVYAAHGPAVLRYCTYSLGSRQTAEDVAAEVFGRYLEHGDRLDDERVEAWLIRVARNLCASQHRALARERRLLARIEKPLTLTDGWSDSSWWEATSELKENERLVIYLRAIEDRPFAEVALLTGKGQSAVKMIYYRAVEKLRGRYESATHPTCAPVSGGVDCE